MNDKEKILNQAPDAELDSFDPTVRAQALDNFRRKVESGEIVCDASGVAHNLHCHTFYSYNANGWSPSHIAAMAKVLGFKYAGMVDFDVLNGVDEFRAAARGLGIPCVCGMETRVYIKEYADKEINSPGEVGVAYHMGIGFKRTAVPDSAKEFARNLAARAAGRTRTVVERVNAALKDLTLDFDRDVIPLTPAGNPTERHVCGAYRTKAIAQFGSPEKAMEFWKKVLKLDDAKAAKCASSIAALEGAIRSALMKSGGPGYIKPDATSFPPLDDFNAFVRQCGAIPCICWLNGNSAGEADPKALLKFHKDHGMEAVTVIPDRNWNVADPAKQQALVANLRALMNAAAELNVPTVAGTELNSPGLKLVDKFEDSPLTEFLPQFLAGAEALCARFN